jgi:SAM-dependent MidA family methyltransferase
MPGEWLTKGEVNARYYDTAAGEIVFATEASLGWHPQALAKLIAARARGAGLRRIRILELGANNCEFARAAITELRRLSDEGEAGLDRIDYLAVELARASLEAVAEWEESTGVYLVRRPATADTALVALVAAGGVPAVNLGLVHSEANEFVRSNREPFDFVILNELLDDMAYRAYFADEAGRRFEAFPLSRDEGERWTVRITAEEVAGEELAGMPPGTMTARSRECVELVTGLAGLLASGGMLFVHDYGFAEPYTSLGKYEAEPRMVPPFATLEYDDDGKQAFPRSFFRVFGNEAERVVQVTNDVNFAELAAALAPVGSVITIPHGNQIAIGGGAFAKGQGVFLAEFGLLELADDVQSLLERLARDQAQLRDEYVRDWMRGQSSVFLDLIYVKD